MTPKNVDSLMEQFLKWMRSVDGGHKTARDGKQKVRQIVAVLKMASPDDNINALFNHKTVRDLWLTPYSGRDDIEPGTVKNYCGTLKLFFKFLMCEKPKEVVFSQEEAQSMIATTSNWQASFKGKAQIQHFRKQLKDLKKKLAPKDILAFDKSDYAVKTRGTIRRRKNAASPPSAREFTTARDFIITSLILGNAIRPGVIHGITLREFKDGGGGNGDHIVYVMDHKTKKTSGPRAVVFPSELYDLTIIYIHRIRNLLSDMGHKNDDKVFTSLTGNRMSSSLVNGQWTACFEKATGWCIPTNATIVRKSFVSYAHKNHGDTETKRNLANMMCHSEKTAASSYFLEDKAENVAKTFNFMKKAFKSSATITKRY